MRRQRFPGSIVLRTGSHARHIKARVRFAVFNHSFWKVKHLVQRVRLGNSAGKIKEFRMPKIKTDRGAAKRFKITGTGKLRRRRPNRSHLLEKKSSTRTRRLGREADQFQRNRAVIELCIRDIKDSALEHLPSGNFSANGVWLACAALAHNLIRWSAILGKITKPGTLTVSQTIRTRFISIAARLVNISGKLVLRGPKRWPWAQQFLTALTNLRLLLAPTTG